jgi:cytoskeletal protein CcmA (bactofilin family)
MPDAPPDKNNLSKDVEIKGSIKFANELVFDGNLEGNISSAEGILTIGQNGNVRGDVKTKAVILEGNVKGNITVQERCELRANAQLSGDLKAVRLSLEDGATLLGKLEVNPNNVAIKQGPFAQRQEPQKIGALL